MYAKVFRRMFTGPLGDTWEAWVTFVAILAFADADGVVDMTEGALVRHSGLPAEVVAKGLAILLEPDPRSSMPAESGRRIVPLEGDGQSGWAVVNHSTYRDMHTADEVRESNRLRQQRRRDRVKMSHQGPHESQPVTPPSRDVTQSHGQSRYTDTDTDTDTSRSLSDSSPEVFLVDSRTVGVPLPLTQGKQRDITQTELEEWGKLYPAVDVMQELRKMRGWLLASPSRRKTARGVLKFVHNWLGKAQDQGGGRMTRTTPGGSRNAADADYIGTNLGGGE